MPHRKPEPRRKPKGLSIFFLCECGREHRIDVTKDGLSEMMHETSKGRVPDLERLLKHFIKDPAAGKEKAVSPSEPSPQKENAAGNKNADEPFYSEIVNREKKSGFPETPSQKKPGDESENDA